MNEFKEGDTVQLKSGGPVMTVDSDQGDGTVWCIWFSTAKDGTSEVKGNAFKYSMLTKVS